MVYILKERWCKFLVTQFPLEYYIGKACKKFRRGILDLSIDSLIKKSKSDVSVVSISNFERGQIHSTKMITVYFNASKSVQSDQSETLNTFLKMAIDEYFVSLQKINTLR